MRPLQEQLTDRLYRLACISDAHLTAIAAECARQMEWASRHPQEHSTRCPQGNDLLLRGYSTKACNCGYSGASPLTLAPDDWNP